MLPPPLGERGGYPHSCHRELPNDGKKRVSTEPYFPKEKGLKNLIFWLFFIGGAGTGLPGIPMADTMQGTGKIISRILRIER
jgi:hypothetical protein